MKQIHIFDSPRILDLACWKMPKSNLWYPVLFYSGVACNSKVELDEELLQLKLLFEELYESFVLSKRLIWIMDKLEDEAFVEALVNNVENVFLDSIHIVGYPAEIQSSKSSIVTAESKTAAIEEIINLDKKKRYDGGSKLTDAHSLINNIELYGFKIAQPENIKITFYSFQIDGKSIGLAKLSGDAGLGSEHSDECSIIKRRLNQFDKKYAFNFLVVDSTELQYAWGNDLQLYPSRFRFINLPNKVHDSFILIVTEEQLNTEGFSYLLRENEQRIIHSADRLHDRVIEIIKKYET